MDLRDFDFLVFATFCVYVRLFFFLGKDDCHWPLRIPCLISSSIQVNNSTELKRSYDESRDCSCQSWCIRVHFLTSEENKELGLQICFSLPGITKRDIGSCVTWAFLSREAQRDWKFCLLILVECSPSRFLFMHYILEGLSWEFALSCPSYSSFWYLNKT